MSVKITNLTRSNIDALRIIGHFEVLSGNLILGQTTAEWPGGTTAQAAREWVMRKMSQLPTTGHPRASLHAVVRKLETARQKARDESS